MFVRFIPVIGNVGVPGIELPPLSLCQMRNIIHRSTLVYDFQKNPVSIVEVWCFSVCHGGNVPILLELRIKPAPTLICGQIRIFNLGLMDGSSHIHNLRLDRRRKL